MRLSVAKENKKETEFAKKRASRFEEKMDSELVEK